MKINEVSENLYVIEFTTEIDKTRVMEGKPWLF